ncbi:hypothetical protein F5Y19DRAFT_446565 [Xylariaceae sp. FL1651]|nr:hypothetical protein F5Y19DRAFT_446565 [Xylariaceae sp. FL1651]
MSSIQHTLPGITDRNGESRNNGDDNSDSNRRGAPVGGVRHEGSSDDDDDARPWSNGDDNDGHESEGDVEEPDNDDSGDVDPGIMNNMSDDDESETSLRHAVPRPSPRCRECERIKMTWKEDVTELRAVHNQIVSDLNTRIKQLEQEIARLKNKRTLQLDPWGPRLVDFLDGNPREGDRRYNTIYRDSCRQGGMSVDTNIRHPDLSLQIEERSLATIREYFARQILGSRYELRFDEIQGLAQRLRPIIFPLPGRPLLFLEDTPQQPFHFERLPIDIQYRIWKLIVPNRKLIHCLSRLDPVNHPLDFSPTSTGMGFPRRFHIGHSPCCIATADKPYRILRCLLVSKRWYFVTAHIFYASNTFAFSSLGEFGRFCNNIGKARVQRLVNMEIMWHAARTPRQPDKISLRKLPLAWLMKTSRLQTLVIHINESEKSYMRRAYEMQHEEDYYKDFANEDEFLEDELDLFGMEVRRTDIQPNYRKYRSLRTVQGMDFVYQLRGMKWVRFYDSNAGGSRTMVKDWSFVQDVNNQVTMKKSDSMALRTEIENLQPLTGLEDFEPSDEIMELVKRLYDDTSLSYVSVGGSETSLSTASFDRSAVSIASDDSFDSGYGDDSGDPSRNSLRGHNSGPGRIDEAIELDSDTEMDDDDDLSKHGGSHQGSDISNINSSSGTSSHSGSSGDDHPGDSGLNTTITPQPRSQPPVIDLTQDDEGDNGRRSSDTDHGSSTEGLFVRSGSCTANTVTDFSSDEGLLVRLGGHGRNASNVIIDLTSDKQPDMYIDLTLNDDESDDAMKVDDTKLDLNSKSEKNADKQDRQDYEENHEMEGIKTEEPSSRDSSATSDTDSIEIPSEPSGSSNSDSDTNGLNTGISIPSDPSDSDSSSCCRSKRSRDDNSS